MFDIEKFWSQTKQEGDCLIWTGQTNSEPLFGIFSVLGGRLIAHRVAYELSVGTLPPNSHVGRICDNPLCVAPQHLFLQNSNKSQNPNVDIKKKIISQVVDVGGCWLWKGKAPKCIAISTGLKTLPRAIYEIYHGEIVRGKEVVRTCQQSECLNPEHLTLINKSELGKSNAKLTIEQVQEIRSLAHTGDYGLLELAKKYNTSRQTIYTVVYNLGWYDEKYIPPDKMSRRPRFCRNNHPLSGKEKKPRKSIKDRFWEKVYKSVDGCWYWTAYSNKGWGYFSINHVPQLSHRVAYELSYGSIPEYTKVKHACGNNLCVRPDHLYLEDKMAAK